MCQQFDDAWVGFDEPIAAIGRIDAGFDGSCDHRWVVVLQPSHQCRLDIGGRLGEDAVGRR